MFKAVEGNICLPTSNKAHYKTKVHVMCNSYRNYHPQQTNKFLPWYVINSILRICNIKLLNNSI